MDLLKQWTKELEPKLRAPTKGRSSLRRAATTTPQWTPDASRYTKLRVVLHRLVHLKAFDVAMGCVIIANMMAMVADANANAGCRAADECGDMSLKVLNKLFLCIYIIELLMRVIALHLLVFLEPWNLLDIFIVVTGIADLAFQAGNIVIPDLQMLRVLRVLRILRAVRLLKFFPELYTMIIGFFTAMKAMGWGLFLIMGMLIIWSLVSVEVMYPLSERLQHPMYGEGTFCRDAFGNVFLATLFFFQTLVAQDAWGECVMPMILAFPLTFVIFALALVTVSLGFTNLILAVIVDKAAEAREMSHHVQLKEMEAQKKKVFLMWEVLMEHADIDGDGLISEDELLNAYESEPFVKAALDGMHMSKSELKDYFHLVDEDGCGNVAYHEFIAFLEKAQSIDQNVYLMLLRLMLERTFTAVEANEQAIARIHDHLGLGVVEKRSRRGSMDFMRSSAAPSRRVSSQAVVQSPRKAEAQCDTPADTDGGHTHTGQPATEGGGQWKLLEVPKVSVVSPQPSVASARSDALVPSSFAVKLDEDIRQLQQRMEESFEALSQSLSKDVKAVAQHAESIARHAGQVAHGAAPPGSPAFRTMSAAAAAADEVAQGGSTWRASWKGELPQISVPGAIRPIPPKRPSVASAAQLVERPRLAPKASRSNSGLDAAADEVVQEGPPTQTFLAGGRGRGREFSAPGNLRPQNCERV